MGEGERGEMTHDLLDTTSIRIRLRVVGIKTSIKCKGYGKYWRDK